MVKKGQNYIGETGQNVTIRWDEHSHISKNSEPAKHLNQFPEYRFNWKILRRVPNIVRQRKIHKIKVYTTAFLGFVGITKCIISYKLHCFAFQSLNLSSQFVR